MQDPKEHTLSIGDARHLLREPHLVVPHLYLVLECDRPIASSRLRFSLADRFAKVVSSVAAPRAPW